MSLFDTPIDWFTHAVALVTGVGIGVILSISMEWSTRPQDMSPQSRRDD